MPIYLVALALAVVEPPPQPMEVEVVHDPITDLTRGYATLREAGNRLVISCEPSQYAGPRVSVHARRWLARGNVFTGVRPVIYRFDNLRARRMLWDVDDRHASLTGRRRVHNFLAHLIQADRLVIRVRDIENHRYDLTFRLTGVRPAVEQALAACASRVRPEHRDDYQI